MPRVLSLCSYLPFPVISGGRKRHVRLLEAMQDAGAEPYILTEDVDSAAQEATRAQGWEVEVCPRPRASISLRAHQHISRETSPHNPALWRRARELSNEVKFTQLEEIAVAQYARAIPNGALVALSLHNVDSEILAALTPSSGWKRQQHAYMVNRMQATERRAARRADATITVSEHDQRYFAKLGARASLLAPNGVDDELFSIPEQNPGNRVAFFFGQFDWRPNADGARRYINEAWPRVLSAVPDAKLRIAGPSSQEALGSDAAGSPSITTLGFVDDLIEELAAAALVLAPLWTGGGTRIKVLEGLAAARPIVGTPLGVERIGFEPCRHGLVAPDPAGLADATVRVLRDVDLASRYGGEGRRLADGYRWGHTTRSARELYKLWLE